MIKPIAYNPRKILYGMKNQMMKETNTPNGQEDIIKLKMRDFRLIIKRLIRLKKPRIILAP